MISSLSSTTVKVCKDYHVADQASHDAKPCCRFARLAPADRTLSLDHISAVVSHDVLLLRPNASSAPDAEDQALTAVQQPTVPAAVSANQSRAKATRGKAASTGNAPAPMGLRVGEPARTGRLSWPALGRTSNVSELGVTAGETARIFRLSLPEAGSAGAVRWSKGDVREDSCSGAHPVMHGSHGFESHTTSISSSGGGLGIHEPRSNARGERSALTAPSGRALESANCPAVTRFSPHPGSHAAVSTFHQPGMTETAANNSDLACTSSETAATAIPGPVCAVAALLDLDALVDMNTATLRVRAKNAICATS